MPLQEETKGEVNGRTYCHINKSLASDGFGPPAMIEIDQPVSSKTLSMNVLTSSGKDLIALPRAAISVWADRVITRGHNGKLTPFDRA
jgi:hypothetical protein